MLIFALIILYAYVLAPLAGLPSVPIPGDMWALLQIGFGGYILGRSAEKVTKNMRISPPPSQKEGDCGASAEVPPK